MFYHPLIFLLLIKYHMKEYEYTRLRDKAKNLPLPIYEETASANEPAEIIVILPGNVGNITPTGDNMDVDPPPSYDIPAPVANVTTVVVDTAPVVTPVSTDAAPVAPAVTPVSTDVTVLADDETKLPASFYDFKPSDPYYETYMNGNGPLIKYLEQKCECGIVRFTCKTLHVLTYPLRMGRCQEHLPKFKMGIETPLNCGNCYNGSVATETAEKLTPAKKWEAEKNTRFYNPFENGEVTGKEYFTEREERKLGRMRKRMGEHYFKEWLRWDNYKDDGCILFPASFEKRQMEVERVCTWTYPGQSGKQRIKAHADMDVAWKKLMVRAACKKDDGLMKALCDSKEWVIGQREESRVRAALETTLYFYSMLASVKSVLPGDKSNPKLNRKYTAILLQMGQVSKFKDDEIIYFK